MITFTKYFDPFVIPFTVGVLVLFSVVVYRFVYWFIKLSKNDKRLVGKSLFTHKTILAIYDVAKEALLHVSIFKRSGRLGYMHMSLAFGWFLLIVVGKFETSAYLGDAVSLPHVHVFFRYFFHDEGQRFEHYVNYKFIMDLLLLFVLSGVALAYYKRFRSKALGIKKTTKHTTADKFALAALWTIFPARLLAESITCGIHHTGSFLTNSIGDFLAKFLPLQPLELPAWYLYSTALGVFFIAFPFSRYMHIFAEIPHIFLKRYGVKVDANQEGSIDNFQIAACSRCGICIDPCQMQSQAQTNDMQAVYYLRDRRSGVIKESTAMNCLMCGRCENACPVGIDLNSLRHNTRVKLFNELTKNKGDINRFEYIETAKTDTGAGTVGYFAGCMTSLTPSIKESMAKIFNNAGVKVWYADANGSVCCGRPMELAGDIAGAEKLIEFNKQKFIESGIKTLVTSCPICLKVFKEKYNLGDIEVLHHSQYINRLLKANSLKLSKTLSPSDNTFAYHDPCELGRGSGIYEEPREVIKQMGQLMDSKDSRKEAMCCGGSLANTMISDEKKLQIAENVAKNLEATGAGTIVSSCPICKKTLSRGASKNTKVKDIAEIVAERL